MVLLNGSARDAGNADTVAAHFENAGLALFVEVGRVHRFGILGAEVEHMAHFDTALQLQRALAVRRRVALDDITEIRHFGFREITAEIHAAEVETFLVRADHKVAHIDHGAVRVDLHFLRIETDRAEVAGLAAESLEDFGFSREAEAILQLRKLASLHFIQAVITAKQNEDDLRGKNVPFLVALVRSEHHGLNGLRERQAKEFRHELALIAARGRNLLHFFRRCGAFAADLHSLREFNIRGVLGIRAVSDQIFTSIGDHLEFIRAVAADGTRVSRDRTEHETRAVENTAVGVKHRFVALAGSVSITVERVTVLHDEFTAAHHTETGTALIAELRLNLEEIHRQLAPGGDFLTGNVRDHFFRGRLNHEVALMTILETEQFRAVLFPAARLNPELGRLHDRHQEFDRARTDHFLTDDVLDLADDAKTHRHVRVHTGGQLLDHAGADHQLLADDVGVSGRFFQSGNKKLTGFHENSAVKNRDLNYKTREGQPAAKDSRIL